MTLPTPFIDGYRLIDGNELNNTLANPTWSVTSGVAATTGGTVHTSYRITQTVTQISTSIGGASGVALPQALPGRVYLIVNATANSIVVFAEGDSTVDSVPGDIGALQDANTACFYISSQVKTWIKCPFAPLFSLFSNILVLASISALRARTQAAVDSPPQVSLIENTVPGDGGGIFYLDATDHVTPDNGTTVIVDAAGNRWKRELVQAGYIANIPAGTITSTTVQAALNEIVSNLAATTVGHGAALVGINDAGNYYTSTNVEGALQESAASTAPLFHNRSPAPDAAFNFFTADFVITRCSGPGLAGIEDNITSVWLGKYAYSGAGAVFVAPASQGGSDSNSGASWASPFLTLSKALKLSTQGVIYVWPGIYDSTDFRYTDSSGDKPKQLIAPYGGVTIRATGDDVSAATWAPNGTYGNVYQTTLVTALPMSRLLLTNVLDEYGLATPIPLYTSVAEVDSSTFGWYYDAGSKILYVRKGVENVNTTTKANLLAIYDNRFLIYSTNLYVQGITLDGYYQIVKVAGQPTPELWLKDCAVRYSSGNGVEIDGGGFYAQDFFVYRTTFDNINYNTLLGVAPYGVEINVTAVYAGDIGTYGAGATQPANPSPDDLKNGSSNHTGAVVRMNGSYGKSYGFCLVDTTPSRTWMMGVTTTVSYAPARFNGYCAQGASTLSWLDGCNIGPGARGLLSSSGAVLSKYNTPAAISTDTGGTIVPYTPSYTY